MEEKGWIGGAYQSATVIPPQVSITANQIALKKQGDRTLQTRVDK